MKIIYGKGECVIDKINEPVQSIIIRYKGNVILKHKFAELYNIINNNFYFRNLKSKSMLIHGNNQIHIGFITPQNELNELFKYNGDFEITSVKINDVNVNVELFGVDYYNLIDSNWDSAGKPEVYENTFIVGKLPKKRKSIFNNRKTRQSSRSITTTFNVTTGSY